MEIIESGGQESFRVKCEYCGCRIVYTTHDLGYRVWYPHGFVYCPECKKPLRHKLEYKINPDGKTFFEGSAYAPTRYSEAAGAVQEKWTCSGCGTECNGNFCSKCGLKRPEEQNNSWFCTQCGTRNDGNFCTNCGAVMPAAPKN